LAVLRTAGAIAEGIGAHPAVLVAQVAGDRGDHSDCPDQHDEDERYEDDTNEDRSHHYTVQ
jgi:hypothetical protein